MPKHHARSLCLENRPGPQTLKATSSLDSRQLRACVGVCVCVVFSPQTPCTLECLQILYSLFRFLTFTRTLDSVWNAFLFFKL